MLVTDTVCGFKPCYTFAVEAKDEFCLMYADDGFKILREACSSV